MADAAEHAVEEAGVGLIAKAAKSVLHDAVGPAGRDGARAAEQTAGRTAARSAADDAEHRAVPLTKDEIEHITSLPKGSRPDPAGYLPKEYVDQHLSHFEGGATRFMNADSLRRFGISQRDGTSFIMAKSEIEDVIAKTGGDPRAMERELGLPDHFFNGQVKRVDIDNPGDAGLRMPSGNEAGANDDWIPGGLLPGGIREAVIDGTDVPDDQISVSNFP